LLVEDDSVDAMSVERALNELRATNKLIRVPDGKQALEYLRAKGTEKQCIILSDSNMPRMSSIEFLKATKEDEALRNTSIIVLTTSINQVDVLASFELGAAGYIVKPVNYREFKAAISIIDSYWILSELPNED
jgi:CheY-like chemotaxis protein